MRTDGGVDQIDRRLFPPELFRELERFRLPFRSRPVGRYEGIHRSRRFGDSLEFAELRPYLPGDDLRSVDWNAYRRLGKLFVRRYEAERNRHISVLIDTSASMAVPPERFNAARRLAGAIAVVAHRELDHVRVFPFSDHLVEDHRRTARGGTPLELLAYLSALETGGETGLAPVLRALPAACPRGSAVVLISDCFDSAGPTEGLEAVAAHSIDLVCLHLLAPEESRIERGGRFDLVDSENGGTQTVTVDRRLREAYAREIDRWSAELSAELARVDARYLRVSSDTPVPEILRELSL